MLSSHGYANSLCNAATDIKPLSLGKDFLTVTLVAEGAARLELNYHTSMQVLAGAALGIIFFYVF
jgi:acid phosphatase family membrane protein YuiD